MVPEGWASTRLGNVAEFVTSGSRGWASYYSDEGDHFIRITNLRRSSIIPDYSNMKFVRLPDAGNEGQRTRLKKDDILISITADLGTIGFIDSAPEKDSYINQHIALVRLKSGKTVPKFVAYLLASKSHNALFQQLNDAGAKAGLNLPTIRSVPIYLPPIFEQKRIAEILSSWDRAIETTEKLIANSQAQKKALMQQLLTGKKRLPGFQGPWKKLKLSDLEDGGQITLGRGQVISKKDIKNTPGPYPIYSSSVKGGGLFGTFGNFMFDEELITWSVDGGGNFFYRPKHKFNVTNVCGWLRINTENLSYFFMAQQLQRLHSQLSFDYQTKAHPSVIRELYSVEVPPIDEQKAIGHFLGNADKGIKHLEEYKKQLVSEKAALMQQLLTGKRRVKIEEAAA